MQRIFPMMMSALLSTQLATLPACSPGQDALSGAAGDLTDRQEADPLVDAAPDQEAPESGDGSGGTEGTEASGSGKIGTSDAEGADGGEDSPEGEGSEVVALRELTVGATQKYVRPIGRTCSSDGVTWLPQSGSALEFDVTGTRVQIEVAADDACLNEASLRPRLAVLVDGEVVLDTTMDEPRHTYEVLTADSSRDARIELIHLSEALYGAVGVRSITVTSEAATPVRPTAPRDLAIEFVGDSITCGYGVESAGYDMPFMTTTENFMKTYAYLAAQALDADYGTVCYSGYGVVSGYSAFGERNESNLVPSLYEVVAEQYPTPWDPAEKAYDVVVVSLGTNDSTYTGTDGERMEEFASAYADFLVRLRECNPAAHLVCTLGLMGCEELYPFVEQAVEDYRERTGDTRVTSYLSEPIDAWTEGVGTNGHPTALTQQKCADQLVEVIRREALAG